MIENGSYSLATISLCCRSGYNSDSREQGPHPSNSPAKSASLVCMRASVATFLLLRRVFWPSDLNLPDGGSLDATTVNVERCVKTERLSQPTWHVLFVRSRPVQRRHNRCHDFFSEVHLDHNRVRGWRIHVAYRDKTSLSFAGCERE